MFGLNGVALYLDAGAGGAAGGAGADQAGSEQGGKGEQGGEQSGKGGKGGKPAPGEAYKTWFDAQPDDVKALVTTNEHGLRSALHEEREGRATLKAQLKDLTAKAEKGSDFEKQLTAVSARVEEADSRADFYEAAHAAGVTNLKLAWVVATNDKLFDKKGNPDIEALRKGYPELFAPPAKRPLPRHNAGAGTEDVSAQSHQGMNEFIRRAAGRS